MKKYSHHRGFTLLEVIIVIIVVGVLASLALPRFYSVIEYSRSVEAISAIRTIAQSIERCFYATRDYDQCHFNHPGQGTTIDIDDPGDQMNAHFTYRRQPGGGATVRYRIFATRNNFNDAGYAGDQIRFIYRTDGTLERSGTGIFEAIH